MILARGPQTVFLYNLCCAIFAVESYYFSAKDCIAKIVLYRLHSKDCIQDCIAKTLQNKDSTAQFAQQRSQSIVFSKDCTTSIARQSLYRNTVWNPCAGIIQFLAMNLVVLNLEDMIGFQLLILLIFLLLTLLFHS